MKWTRVTDVFFNILLPLLIGNFCYQSRGLLPATGFLRNHLADSLWAYAFLSTLLVIWDRKLHPWWLASAFILAITLEVFQSCHLISGTGDWADVLTYFVSFSIAIIVNPFFYSRLQHTTAVKTAG
jgi:hypothetical protein